jgi:hypothetical protein
MKKSTISAVVMLAALMASVHALSAQELMIQCSGDLNPSCNGRVEAADSLQHARIVLRVMRDGATVPGAVVRFRATSGSLQPDSTMADQNGYARSMWFRTKGGDSVGVAVDARAGGSSGLAFIRLEPGAPKADARTIVLLERRGFLQSWFENGQLPSIVEVELRLGNDSTTNAINDRATCVANRVLFNRRGAPATVSPDTATASIFEHRCYASTFWSLGEGIGERALDVSLVPSRGFKGDNTLEAEAWVRATPKFLTGFARSRLQPYVGLNTASTRTVRVERVDASGATRSYDTTETTGAAAINPVKARTEYAIVAGVSVPIPIARWGRFDGLSLTGGVDLANPGDRFYGGISALRFLGFVFPVIEGVPIDFHVVGFWARQPELKDATCAAAACVVDKHTRYQGTTWMISADATSILDALVKKLAP